jgi:hypothetical protein
MKNTEKSISSKKEDLDPDHSDTLGSCQGGQMSLWKKSPKMLPN